jgi:hypothetical protein
MGPLMRASYRLHLYAVTDSNQDIADMLLMVFSFRGSGP